MSARMLSMDESDTEPGGARATQQGVTGLLLTNLGTPDAPEPEALRRYLAEFLSDPKVVKLPRLLWLPILYGIVLRTRPVKSAEAYARIWGKRGSPLLANTLNLADRLEGILRTELGPKFNLAVGMRYGNPSLGSALATLKEAGVARLLVLPLYPQYAEATTGSTEVAIRETLRCLRWAPSQAMVRNYYADPAYIAALAESVREHWEARGHGERLIVSFHGIPKKVSESGDPYAGQCAVTAKLLAAELGLADSSWQLAFQSRFGPAEWLKPYTDVTLKTYASKGIRNVDVICPGFPADCLETLEEIALRYTEIFREAGGNDLRYVPALNDREYHVQALARLVIGLVRKA